MKECPICGADSATGGPCVDCRLLGLDCEEEDDTGGGDTDDYEEMLRNLY